MASKKFNPLYINIKNTNMYSKAGQKQIDSYYSIIIEQKQEVSHIIFIVDNNNDIAESFIDELRSSILITDLMRRIYKFWQFLIDINSSKIPHIFVSNHTCLNSFFDFALSCNLRIWTSNEITIGYNENLDFINIFALLSNSLNKQQNRNSWISNNILISESKNIHKYIELQINTDKSNLWEKALSNFIEKYKFNKKAKAKSSNTSFNKVCIENIAKLKTLNTKEIIDLLSKLTITNEFSANSYESICFNFAKHLLSKKSITDEHQKLLLYEPKNTLNTTEVKYVYLNIENYLPPISNTLSLIRRGYIIILFADKIENLISQLEIFHYNMKNFLSEDKFNIYWNKNINWLAISSKKDKVNKLFIEFDVNGFIRLNYNDCSMRLFSLNHNMLKAPRGFTESKDCKFKNSVISEATQALSIKNFIVSGEIFNFLPLTYVLRSYVFETIILLSKYRDGNIGAILQILKKYDWSKLGVESFWENFLYTRHNIMTSNKNVLIKEFNLNSSFLKINSFKDTETIAKNLDLINKKTSKATIYSYFLQDIALYFNFICKHPLLEKNDEIYKLFDSAIFVPKKIMSLKYYVSDLGLSRLKFCNKIKEH